MPAGMTVFNEDNILQIDATYRNLQLRQQQVFTVSGGSTLHQLNYAGGGTPLVFIRVMSLGGSGAVGGGVSLLRMAGSPGNWQFFFRAYCNPGNTLTYQVYVFDEFIASSNLGLEVFDPSGRLCFSSANPPLNIVGMVFGMAGSARDQIRALMQPGRLYAVCQCRGAEYTQSNMSGETPPTYNNTKYETTFSMEGGQFAFSTIGNWTDPFSPTPIDLVEKPGAYLVTDVTGYG